MQAIKSMKPFGLFITFYKQLLCAHCADPESAKKTDNFTVFFARLGSEQVIAARRTLLKLTSDCEIVTKLSAKS